MAPPCGAAILMPEILRRLGVKHYPLVEGSDGADAGEGHRLLALYRRLPVSLRSRIYRWRRHVNQRWLQRGESLGFDPARTKAFDVIIGGAFSGIRLNIKGREPHGVLERGAEAEGFITEISRDLMELTDGHTGRPAISRIIRTAVEFPGPRSDELPDLIVVWNEENKLGTTNAGGGRGSKVRVSSPKIGTVEATNTYCRTGDHLLEGMFVARGPGIAPGRLDRVVPTLDLAPTFARMMGCEMRGVDGVPIPELLDAPVAVPSVR
jgi:predicted AlkP superfamily phosphohydrolase/phosphomutase